MLSRLQSSHSVGADEIAVAGLRGGKGPALSRRWYGGRERPASASSAHGGSVGSPAVLGEAHGAALGGPAAALPSHPDGGDGGVLSSAVGAIPEAWLTYAAFAAVVSNCAADMAAWHSGVEARLLFLAMLHQTSEVGGLRDLGLQLAQELAHSASTRLMPPHAHQLPWVCSRAALVYAAAPFRYSAALAPCHLHLLPGLLAEFVARFGMISERSREAMLQLLLPWVRELAATFDGDDGAHGDEDDEGGPGSGEPLGSTVEGGQAGGSAADAATLSTPPLLPSTLPPIRPIHLST